MPMSVKFEQDGSGVLVSAKGPMDTVVLNQQNEQFYSSETVAKLRYQIVDLREVDNIDIDLNSLKSLAETDKAIAEHTQGLKIAMVVKAGVMEGLAQIYQRHAQHEKLQTKVFYTVEAARNWAADYKPMDQSA